jgi:hypothetical protein
MKKKFIFLLTNVLLFLILGGCAKSISYDEVKDYSDSIVNSLLCSINNLDYNTFSSFLSNELNESYTLSVFQKECTNIINKEGTFEYAEFYAGEERNGYISLIYHIKFSNKDETTPISITFKKTDSNHKIQQLYFDSDLLKN